MKKENFKSLMNSWNDLLNESQIVLPISEDFIEEDAFFMPNNTSNVSMQMPSNVNHISKANACIEMAHCGDNRLVDMCQQICSTNNGMLAKCMELCMCACKCDRDGCCSCLSEICSCPNCAQVCAQCCGC